MVPPNSEKGLSPVIASHLEENSPATVPNDDLPKQYLTGVRLWTLVFPTTLVAFLVFLDSSIITTAIPTITSDFGNISDIGWYSSIFLLSNACVQPLAGKLYAHFNLKMTYLQFLALFEVGSLICALAQTAPMLIAGRAVAGLGGAGLVNGTFAVIASSAPLKSRAAIIGMILAIGQMGLVCGPIVGGLLTEDVSWRWCFYINLPAGAVVVILLLVTPIPKHAEGRVDPDASALQYLSSLDWLGFVLFAASAVMFLIAMQFGSTSIYPWKSATVIGLFAGAGGGWLAFLLWQRRRCLTFFLQMGNVVISMYYLQLWFQSVKGASPAKGGLYILPLIGSQILLALSSGWFVGKTGQYTVSCIVNGVLVSIGSGLTTVFNAHTTVGYWVGAEILMGSGRGCGLQMPIVAIQGALPPREAATAVSLAIFCQSFGGAFLSSVAETILLSSLTAALGKSAPNVDAQTIINAGGSDLSSVVPASDLASILVAYNDAIVNVFWLMTATAIAITFTCLGLGFKKRQTP